MLRDELFIKLVFLAREKPAAILELIDKQKALYLQAMHRLTRRKLALKKEGDSEARLVTELILDAGLFHAEADLKWLALCEAKITRDSRGGCPG
ncbi:MAG: hypothetical protein AB1634_10150 [Thermodesulfobacteriota bacterium]